MGFLKKLTRPISKILDKIIPNEIKPALPYLSAFAPFMMGPTSGIMGSSMLRRGLMSGAINLGSQLAQEGSEGEFNPLSLLLASGTGAMTSPDAPGFFEGMQTSNMSPGESMARYGTSTPPTGIMSSVSDAIGKGGETASRWLQTQGDILRPGGEELTMKNVLTAGSVPVTQGTADLAMITARQALDEYNAGLEEGSEAWYDDNARRVAIRSAMEAAGHVEETILDALASLGLREGGIVGLKKGGRIGYQEGELVEESEVVEESKGDNMLVEIAKVIFKLVPPTSFMFAAKDAYDMYQSLEDEDKQKVQDIGKKGLRFAGIPGMAASAGMSLMDKFKGKEMADGGMMSVLPRGAEMDYRGGGMIPMGSKERADDVPARLSKNEFVMTADAVRAAGGGSVNRGAKRMYDLMHNLEARV